MHTHTYAHAHRMCHMCTHAHTYSLAHTFVGAYLMIFDLYMCKRNESFEYAFIDRVSRSVHKCDTCVDTCVFVCECIDRLS